MIYIKYKRLIVLLFCIFHISAFYSQVVDTVIVINESFSYMLQRNKPLSMKIKNDTILITKHTTSESLHKSWDILNKSPYCIIKDKKGRVIEKGIWFGEAFNGAYEAYYKNGILKCKGNLNNNNKQGKWLYYDEKGKLIKEETL